MCAIKTRNHSRWGQNSPSFIERSPRRRPFMTANTVWQQARYVQLWNAASARYYGSRPGFSPHAALLRRSSEEHNAVIKGTLKRDFPGWHFICSSMGVEMLSELCLLVYKYCWFVRLCDARLPSLTAHLWGDSQLIGLLVASLWLSVTLSLQALSHVQYGQVSTLTTVETLCKRCHQLK